jgi:hypothetical protein
LEKDDSLEVGTKRINGGRYNAKRHPRRQDSIKEALSSFSDILSIGGRKRGERYVSQLHHALEEMEEELESFDTHFKDEQKRIRAFYYDKLTELEDRLDFLRRRVDHAAWEQTKRTRGGRTSVDCTGEYENCVSPFSPQKRKRHQETNSKHDIFSQQKLKDSDEMDIEASSYQTIEKSSTGTSDKTDHYHFRRVTDVRLSDLLQEDNVNLGGIDDTEDDYGLYDYSHEGHRDDNLTDEKWNAQAESIKRSIVSQYRSAKFLQNYAMLNITGFVKIAKKFDRIVPSKAGKYQDALDSSNMMNDAKDVEKLSAQYERYYANWFCEGDTRAAKVQMLSKRADGLEMDWSQLQFGYRMGMCAVLAIWVCWDCVWGLVGNGDSTIGARAAFPVFRACGGLLLLQWFWGCSVFVWTRYRVNYIYLFDMVPSTVSTPFGIYAQAVDNTLIFLVLMLLYYKVRFQMLF